MNTILRCFKELTTGLASPFDNENVLKSILYVKIMVCIEQTIEYKDLEYVIISDDYEIDTRPIRNSFFYSIFENIIDKLPAYCKTSKSNEYYSPHILQDITNQYMGLLPLWSGIMLGDLTRYVPNVEPAELKKGDAITRDTNCTIENYFGNLKSGLPAMQRY